MCLGIPGLVVELDGSNPHLAIADVFGAQRQINVGLIEDGVVPGDWVLLHAGFALNKLSPEELDATRTSLQLVGAGSEEALLSSLEAELAERSQRRTEQEEFEQWV